MPRKRSHVHDGTEAGGHPALDVLGFTITFGQKPARRPLRSAGFDLDRLPLLIRLTEE